MRPPLKGKGCIQLGLGGLGPSLFLHGMRLCVLPAQQYLSPWHCARPAKARSLQNSPKERGPTTRLVKGGNRLVWKRLLACSRARAHTGGRE